MGISSPVHSLGKLEGTLMVDMEENAGIWNYSSEKNN